MDPGTYTLLVALEEPARITFGAVGTRDLDAGYYTYTGSAFGPGGLSRVTRHREVATGERTTRHWHVDYLIGHDDTIFLDAWTAPGADAECRFARSIDGRPIPGIGATDCDCPSHVHYGSDREHLVASLQELY